MWTKVENETIYPQDLTLLKYFKIRIHKSIFHFVFPDLFFDGEIVDFVGCRQQLGSDKAGCDNYEAGDTRGEAGRGMNTNFDITSGCHVISLSL